MRKRKKIGQKENFYLLPASESDYAPNYQKNKNKNKKYLKDKNKINKRKQKKNNSFKRILFYILSNILIFIILMIYLLLPKKGVNVNVNEVREKRIGVINMDNGQNIGNILVKFALYKKLKDLGFDSIMIAKNFGNVDISFLNRTVNLKLIKESFYELNEADYDVLILNSDQTWSKFDEKYYIDNAFLKFAQNWKIPKFIYAASMGSDRWIFDKEDDEIGKKLLKDFKGISFREKYLVKMAEEHLGIKSEFVLDPTLLIDKNYYLDEIKDYKRDFNFNEKYLLTYILNENDEIKKFINESCKKLNYKIYDFNLHEKDYIENFLFGINASQAVITDSFHGTVFSIIFNKPFISFINVLRGKGRFDSLRETFNLENRIISNISNDNTEINLLLKPLYINLTLLNGLKNFSINFLKNNLCFN